MKLNNFFSLEHNFSQLSLQAKIPSHEVVRRSKEQLINILNQTLVDCVKNVVSKMLSKCCQNVIKMLLFAIIIVCVSPWSRHLDDRES